MDKSWQSTTGFAFADAATTNLAAKANAARKAPPAAARKALFDVVVVAVFVLATSQLVWAL
jgi:hypothetical protein